VNEKPSSRRRGSFGRIALAELRALRQKAADYWIDHTGLDFAATFAICVCLRLSVFDWFTLTAADRSVWLQTLAGAIAAVIGIGTVAVTLVHTTGLPGSRARAEIETGLRRQYLGCIRTLLAALALVCTLFAVDRSKHQSVHDLLLVASMCLSLMRTARLFWLLRRMVEIVGDSTSTRSDV
jgi:hypothetical protein